MILSENKEWRIAYRTVTRTPTEMSEFGSNWDDIEMGPWRESGDYGNKADAVQRFWILRDMGYDCRFHEITTSKVKMTMLDPQRPANSLDHNE